MRVEGWMFGVAILAVLGLVVVAFFLLEARIDRGLDELAFTPRFAPDVPGPARPYDYESDGDRVVDELDRELLDRVAAL